MKHALALATCLVTLYGSDASAQGPYLYGGLHPVHPAAGGGFCYTATPHAHDYPIDPAIAYLYRAQGGHQYFVGDIYDFGYEGDAFPYYGHHPLPEWDSFCYLDGLHYHPFLPGAALASAYVVFGGYYYYRGSFPSRYFHFFLHYHRAHSAYWYLPAYRGHHAAHDRLRRSYGRSASITFLTRPPALIHRHRGPPPLPPPGPSRRSPAPAYRFHPHGPESRDTSLRPAPHPGLAPRPTVPSHRQRAPLRAPTQPAWRRR